jgi:hypothetical protein
MNSSASVAGTSNALIFYFTMWLAYTRARDRHRSAELGLYC